MLLLFFDAIDTRRFSPFDGTCRFSGYARHCRLWHVFFVYMPATIFHVTLMLPAACCRRHYADAVAITPRALMRRAAFSAR